jgi:hypothetical protein
MRLVLIAICLACAGCAITPQQAIPIALREIKKRNLPLPNPYSVSANPDRKIEEPGIIETWAVEFRDPAHKKPLYLVEVNRYNHQVELFLDRRHVVPGINAH